MDTPLIQAGLLLAGVAILGALLPMLGTWSDRSLHLLLSFAAGVFLGALFLELLPELASGDDGDWLSSRLPWAAALAALLLLFFLEHIWLRERAGRAGRHLVVWLGTFTGLTTHAFVVGLGLSTLATKPGVLQPFVMTLAIHKAAESFSLATVMRLAELPARRAWSWMGVFVLATPLGIFLGLHLQPAEAEPGSLGPILQGLAAGTFLYVAAYNLLPEVFHGREQRRSRVLGLLAGLAVFSLATPH